jgi:hypothetical protein
VACGPFRIDLGSEKADTAAELMGTGPFDEGIGDACMAPKQLTRTVTFPRSADRCPWYEGDNLAPAGSRMTARVEQVVGVELPAVGQVCGLSIEPTGWEVRGDVSLYDDQLLLVVGGVVVAASSPEPVELLSTDADGLPRYAWSMLVGQPFDPSSLEPWCLGPMVACEVPAPSQAGPFEVPLDRRTAVLVGEALLALPEVALVVVGDNDADTDCAHDALTVELTLSID